MHLYGAPKIWYSIAREHWPLLDQLVHDEFPEAFKECSNWEAHKAFHFTPDYLRSKGIPVSVTIQNVGDIIITWPNGYHAGFNTGFSINIAINHGKLNVIAFNLLHN